MSIIRRLWLPSASVVLLALAVPARATDESRGAGTHTNDKAFFKASEYEKHVTHLASEELEGRGTGQEGIDKAARYISRKFKKWGVKPAGEDGTFYQEFNVRMGSRLGRTTRLSIGTDGKRARDRREVRKDYIPVPFSKSDKFDGEVVFAGYGIVNKDNEYDDYDGLDVKDKVVLVMRRAPGFGEFGRTDGSFTTKARLAAKRGAKAILVVNKPDDDGGLYNFNRRSFGSAEIPTVHITHDLANKMLEAGDAPSLADLAEGIDEHEKPASRALEGVSVRGRVSIRPVNKKTRNVIGVIPGAGPQKDEYIVVGASRMESRGEALVVLLAVVPPAGHEGQ